MRLLYSLQPGPAGSAAEVDPYDVYGRLRPRADRLAALRVNMISSVDGASSVAGRTAGLGGPTDRALLVTFRSLADAVLVGAGTARSEHYGPVRLPAELRARREASGLAPVPPVVIVTRSCRLDWSAPLFTAPETGTIVVTSGSADAENRAQAERVARVIVAGNDEISLAGALAALAGSGMTSLLCEGGPSLLADLATAQLIDELCLTIAPTLVPSPAGRITNPSFVAPPVPLELLQVLEADDGYLFLRYRRPL